MTAPMRRQVMIQPGPVGKVVANVGIAMVGANGATAVAETVIMEPARKQNRIPLAKL